jgi:hypothetical protein
LRLKTTVFDRPTGVQRREQTTGRAAYCHLPKV